MWGLIIYTIGIVIIAITGAFGLGCWYGDRQATHRIAAEIEETNRYNFKRFDAPRWHVIPSEEENKEFINRVKEKATRGNVKRT